MQQIGVYEQLITQLVASRLNRDRFAANDFVLIEQMNTRMAVMCHYDFWQQPGPKLGFKTLAHSLQALHQAELNSELIDLLVLG